MRPLSADNVQMVLFHAFQRDINTLPDTPSAEVEVSAGVPAQLGSQVVAVTVNFQQVQFSAAINQRFCQCRLARADLNKQVRGLW